MNWHSKLGVFLTLLCGAAFAQTPAAVNPQNDITLINHIVFIVKENRTFDNFFGTFPGADGATSGKISTGAVIPLPHAEDQYGGMVGHDQNDWVIDYDGGAMDGWDLENPGNNNGDYLSMSQHYESDIPNYWAYAKYFAIGDRMFSSFGGPSFPAHLFTIAAQAGESIQIPASNTKGHGQYWGCDAFPTTTVRSEDPEEIYFDQFPCFSVLTVADLLNNVGITWKSYAPIPPATGYWFSTFDAIRQIRQSSQWTTNVVSDENFTQDALAGNLPAVSWVVTGEHEEDDHPPHSICLGENWTVTQLNAIMQGPDWNSTAVFIVWDDWGGLYDHVPPPQVDEYGFGGRVPFLIVSPYARSGAIVHTIFEFSSVLKFIETRFGLPSLTARDAVANDILDAFDFNQRPLNPLVLQPRGDCPLIAAHSFFGNVPLGKTRPSNSLNLLNNRPTVLTIQSVVATAGSDYTVVNGCGSTVQPMGQCPIDIAFKPTATGVRPGQVTITDSDATSPQVITLIGTGTDLSLSQTFVRFPGPVPAGASSTQPVTLKNVGQNQISIDSVYTGKHYSQTNNCTKPLFPGASCTVQVTFTPHKSGIQPGNLIVNDSGVGSPHSAYLYGIGEVVATSPAALAFGTVPVGSHSQPLTVSIQSYGEAPVLIGTIKVGVDFAQTNDCPAQLPLNGSCQVMVTFNPATAGAVTRYLDIPSSDVSGPNRILLTGTGQ
jgi:phospholipase C